MDVHPSKLHGKLIGRLVRANRLDGIVEFHGVDVDDGHVVLLLKVRHDVPGLMRALKEHFCLEVLSA